jgi:peptidoglycan L-alanyl-D-glutamate endopeptidase CwlK
MTATFRFGTRSEGNLLGVHHELVNVVRRALHISNVDFAVIEGLRTKERQHELFAKGRSAPGPKVTWTLDSKHCHGLAVDLLPVNPATGKVDGASWNYRDGFTEIAASMFAAAESLDVIVRWGKDWNMNGKPGEKGEADSPHFELVGGA